ncbi:MAG: hypothetical protein AB2535_09660 [Candidatus Thiodiazotropha endolucinida]
MVIGGHAGIPFGEELGGRYWLNSGVIGMPANDGTRNGWYLVLIPESKGVQCVWKRLGYDAEAAYASMQESGRSDGYAKALITGLCRVWIVCRQRRLRGSALSLSPLTISSGN